MRVYGLFQLKCGGTSAPRLRQAEHTKRCSRSGSPASDGRLCKNAGTAREVGQAPHMLRNACGFALANKGHDTGSLQAYLGHKNIQHTVRHTELSADLFKEFWQ
jgi:site-specific recombinase XerD